MRDLDFRGNILSGTKYRVSPEGVSLMDETNNLAINLLERFIALAQPLLEHINNSGCHKRTARTEQHYFCDEQHAFIHIT